MAVAFTVAIPYDELADVCRRHHIRKLMLFGSVLGAGFRPDSDIDMLAEFEPEANVGFFGLVAAQAELTALFGREVDLLTPGALSPHYRDKVFRSARPIYER